MSILLSQVFSTNQTACLTALGQLDELFKDQHKWVLVSDRVDQLLMACYMQYRNVLNKKMSSANDESDALKLLNYITAVLLSMYHHHDLAQNASSSSLYDLLQVHDTALYEEHFMT